MRITYIILAYLLDLFFGDPRWMPHPVKGIGKLISFLDNRLRGKSGKVFERVKGMLFAFLVVGISTFCAYLLLHILKLINPFLGKIFAIYLAYTTIAAKDLYLHGKAVLDCLKSGNIDGARQRLSFIVGRDTQLLSKDKIITAAVESIAENTSDGVIAPLFYLFLGGPVLAIFYKAVNTLDSMVGHKNKQYIHFGWFSAKADDIMNFIPVRFTALLMPIAALLSGNDINNSFRILFRDGRKHSSPNSGLPEAAMSGALGIQLGGPCAYRGNWVQHPYIGDAKKNVNLEMIQKSLIISVITSVLVMTLGTVLLWKI